MKLKVQLPPLLSLAFADPLVRYPGFTMIIGDRLHIMLKSNRHNEILLT